MLLPDRSIIVHFASGNGGNKFYLVPSLNLVIAITSSAYNQHYGQERSQDILLKVLSLVRCPSQVRDALDSGFSTRARAPWEGAKGRISSSPKCY
jgi:hypothetical protein